MLEETIDITPSKGKISNFRSAIVDSIKGYEAQLEALKDFEASTKEYNSTKQYNQRLLFDFIQSILEIIQTKRKEIKASLLILQWGLIEIDEAAQLRIAPCYQVEYDRDFHGGNYDGMGEFAYIPERAVEIFGSVEAAFAFIANADPKHIIHYSEDDRFTRNGEEYEDPEEGE